MDQDLISVNIIARNAQATLAKTLESVAFQQGVLMEIVFVDDASTDGTLSVVESFVRTHPEIPLRLIRHKENLGIAKSRNAALTRSGGPYVAVLDSDDAWTDPRKLRSQLDFLAAHPDHAVVGTDMRLMDAGGKTVGTTRYATADAEIRNRMLVQNQFCHSSVLMRKSALDTLPFAYDEALYIWEDYDLFLRLGTSFGLANLGETWVDYFSNPKKYTFRKKFKLLQAEFEILKRYARLYPGAFAAYAKRIAKAVLILLHLK